MTRIKLNFLELLQSLERQKNGRRYTYSEIADKAGLSRQTATKLFTGKSKAIDLATIDKLLAFFAAEGMPVTVGDLFTVTE